MITTIPGGRGRLAAGLVPAIAMLVGGACANIEAPPGGPPDQTPPILLGTVPESLGVYPDFHGRVEFIFNEVVSEGSSPNLGLGSGTLERLLILSPSDEVPKISWRRNRVTLRPREGWRPNTVYRVQLLPGITDVERNSSDASTVLTFATGGAMPSDTLRGQLINWPRGRAQAGGLILAILMPDSLTYRAFADSAGRFAVGPLPAGEYLVYGVVDQDRNHRLGRRESFDSVRVASGENAVGVLWAFAHDTTGPRVKSLAIRDSLTITVSFTQYLDPLQRVDSTAARVVLLPDSLPVGVKSLLPQAEHDSLYPNAAPRDSATADTTAADSAAAGRPPKGRPPHRPPALPAQPGDTAAPKGPEVPDSLAGATDSAAQSVLDERPRLFDRLVLRLAEPLVPDGRYFISVSGIRNVNGVTGEGGAGLVVPPPPPPPPEPDSLVPVTGDSLPVPADSAAPPAAADSLEGKADSAAAPADSLRVSDP